MDMGCVAEQSHKERSLPWYGMRCDPMQGLWRSGGVAFGSGICLVSGLAPVPDRVSPARHLNCYPVSGRRVPRGRSNVHIADRTPESNTSDEQMSAEVRRG